MTTVTEFNAKLVVGDANLDRLESAVNDAPGQYTTTSGVAVDNLRKRLDDLGYSVPVTFASGLTVNSGKFTVSYQNVVYAANASQVPFTTTSTFDPTQWLMIATQGDTEGTVAAGGGPIQYPPQQRATNLWDAIADATSTSRRVGFAETGAVTGGGSSGVQYIVTTDHEHPLFPISGSIRRALEDAAASAQTAHTIIFAPGREMVIDLTESLNTVGIDNLTIAAPGGNVKIRHPANVAGIRVNSTNVIISGIEFEGVAEDPDEPSADRDAIAIDPNLCKAFWVDRCTGVESKDGFIDVIVPSGGPVLTTPTYGSITNCVIRGYDKSILVYNPNASFTDATMIYLSVINTWFDHCAQRNPSARQQAFIHVANCVFGLMIKSQSATTSSALYGPDARTGGAIYVEECFMWRATGTGEKAVSQGDTNGSVGVSNVQTLNSMTIDDTSNVTAPTYTTPLTLFTVAGGETGRVAALRYVTERAGARRNAGPDGIYTLDLSSTQEPNGVHVRAPLDQNGRYIRATYHDVSVNSTRSVAVGDNDTVTVQNFRLSRANTVTIGAAGLLTVTGALHAVAPNTGTSDGVSNFQFGTNGPVDGQIVRLFPGSDAWTITLPHDGNWFYSRTGADVVMVGRNAGVTLIYNEPSGKWNLL